MHCVIFLPVTGMKCSYGKMSSPLTEIPVGKTEISVTEPSRPLIWTHQSFYKGFRGKVRSRKPGQPGQPGSYEEALSLQKCKQGTFPFRILFLTLSWWLLVFLYFEFQVGKWNAAQRAVFYESVLPNIRQPDRGSLDGSFHKIVVAEVRNTG